MTDQAQPQEQGQSLAELTAAVRRCQREETRARRGLESRQRATRVSVARALAGGVNANDLAALLEVTRQRIYQMRDEALAPRQSP